MADVAISNAFAYRDLAPVSFSGSVNPSWHHRLAGTAYVETLPMQGFVIAMSLDGPTIVGATEINPDGSWEITGIAQKYDTKELIVLGISRDANDNYAIVSRVKTVN